MGLKRLHRLATITAILTLLFSACQQFSLFDELGGSVKGSDSAVSIAPAAIEMVAGGALTFVASGGTQPYSFAMESGLGSVDPSTGAYVASVTPGNDVVSVTDAVGETAQANVAVVSVGGPLFISPIVVSVFPLSPFTFVAGGGVPPYSFAITTNNSGAALVPANSEQYVAGPSVATDTVTVTDSSAVPLTATATVNVTSVVTNVDYFIDEGSGAYGMPAAFPTGGSVSNVDFTITNSGSADGSQLVSWMLYLSQDGSLGAGDHLVDQGTIAPLGSGAESATISANGNWPFVVEGGYTIFLRVSAPDDLNAANDTTSGDAVTVNPRDVNYAPAIVGYTPSANAGGNASALIDFDINNLGIDDGATTVHWTAWMSIGDNDIIDAGDIVLSAGSVPGITGLNVTNVVINNALWPTTPNTDWRLIIEVSAADEPLAVLADNIDFAGPIDVHLADVDYDVTALAEPPAFERIAGRAFTGDFDAQNIGADNGTADVHWVAYLSADTLLDEALDSAFDSGKFAGGLVSLGVANQSFSGVWPTAASSYYILIDLICGEDNNSGNDDEASALITTTQADVDYTAVINSFPASANVGGDASGLIDFDIDNNGLDDGAATVYWTAWMSVGDNDIVDAGDVVIGSGSTPGIIAAGFSSITVDNALWPTTADADWRIIVAVQADDEPGGALADNQIAGGPISVQTADIDYEVSVVANPAVAELKADRPFTASVTISNIGSVNGTSDLTWVAYISTDATLNIGVDEVIDSGVVSGGINALNNVVRPFSGVWPTATGSYYLIVGVVNGEDTGLGNNVNDGGMVSTTAPDVDYVVSVVNAPLTGVAGGDASGMIDFTLNNIGGDDGWETVRWTMWMSMADADILDVNDVMIGSGTIAPLLGGGSQLVGPISNIQWPASSAADWNVIVFVESDDDVVLGDFNFNGPIDIAFADIDYFVSNLIEPPPPERLAGRPFAGFFDITNIGLDNGTAEIQWIAYYTDRTPIPLPIDDILDTPFDSGTVPGINGAASDFGIAYNGIWPETPVPEDYQILIKLISGEDQSPGNNEAASILVAVAEANVDYDVLGVTMSTPNAPGSPLLESFTLDNVGINDGYKNVYWTAHMSLGDTDNDDPGDILIDSGIELPMSVIEAPRGVSIDGFWPSTTGATWYLVVEATSIDDLISGNNEEFAGAITIAALNVDYRVDSFNPPLAPDLRTERSFSNTFTIRNNGADAGAADITWYLYISDNATLEEGTDTVFASGTQSALGSFTSQSGINYTGEWPAVPTSYFIISKIEADEDINLADNIQTWGSWVVVVPDVDYQVASVNNLGSTTAGDPLSAQFEFRNNGTDAGLLPVDWVAVLSTDSSYDPGVDTVIDAAIEAPLLGGANDAGNLIDATWPATAGSYWIIVAVESPDETGPSPDWIASSMVNVASRQVDYRPDPGSIAFTGGDFHSGGAFSGEFTFSNLMADDGQQLIDWAVYASLDAILDGGDVLIESDAGIAPVSAFGTSPLISFNGMWPLSYGDYRIIVKVTAADDISNVNDSQVSGPTYNVGNYYDESIFEPNDDFLLLADIYAPGIRFEPGMSVMITGDLENNGDDVIEFDTGSASSLTFAMMWGASHDVDMYIMDGPNSFPDGIGITNVTTLSMTWIVDSPDTLRWVDIDNAKVPALGAYTLIVTAN